MYKKFLTLSKVIVIYAVEALFRVDHKVIFDSIKPFAEGN